MSVYLQTLPGVVTSGDRGGELFIRGGTPAQRNLILVDKMPIVKPFHISNLFSAFPQSVISNVDLYAGGFGAEYVGATSSVMDVSLRQKYEKISKSVASSPYIISAIAEGPIEMNQQSLMVMGRYSVIEEIGPELTGEDVPLKFSDMLARYSVNWEGLTCNVTALHTYDRGKINPKRNVSLGWENTAIGARCLGYSEELKTQ